MKFKKPNQHGAWAMIIMPVLFGIFAGHFSFYQILFFISWFMIFFFIDNLLFFIKQRRKDNGYLKGAALFFGLAAIFLIPIMIHEPRILIFFLMMLPFSMINIYFAQKRNERHVLNDFAAVTIFSIAGTLSYFIGNHTFDIKMLEIFLISMLYFIGTTFYVKTLIREKKSIFYRNVSFLYHAFILIAAFLIHPLISIAFLPSLFRAIYAYGKGWKPKKIGMLEIANAVFITIIVCTYFTQFNA